MQITQAQIDRFLQGVCTKEEAAAIAAYLEEHPAVLDAWLKNDWDGADADTALSAGLSEEMYRYIIEHHIDRNRTPLPLKQWMWAAAAAVMTILATWGLFQKNNSKPAMMASLQPAETVNDSSWQEYRNDRNKKDTLTLQDGSIVYLYKHSAVRYQVNRRAIWLEGKATFSVTRDPHAPFVVYAGQTAITVLGTCFNIDRTADRVTITLYSGKISVQPAAAEQVVLVPGQQLIINKDVIAINETRKTIKESSGDAMTFNNTPMQEVLNTLSGQYNTPISYDEQEMKHRYFTGNVLPTDSLKTILSVISQMHGLTIAQHQDTVIVRKSHR